METVKKLCNTLDVILLQEHWLRSNELNFPPNIQTDFSGAGTICYKGILKGSPYGGVGILLRKNMAQYCKDKI